MAVSGLKVVKTRVVNSNFPSLPTKHGHDDPGDIPDPAKISDISILIQKISGRFKDPVGYFLLFSGEINLRIQT
jgi:hypothetical protein